MQVPRGRPRKPPIRFGCLLGASLFFLAYALVVVWILHLIGACSIK